jgi:hypothetical protein
MPISSGVNCSFVRLCVGMCGFSDGEAPAGTAAKGAEVVPVA